MSDLKLNSLTKTFDNNGDPIVAVDDTSIDIEDGEFLVLVGPSGCGKSTTLRMIAGLETISGGTIELADQVVNGVRPADRDIAMVFQSYALYPHMTVRENMSFGLEQSTTLTDDAIERRVEDTASKMDIEDLLDRKPSELSGGQQQRVALGRAIVREPEVFLMDEPLSNLDAKLRAQMRTELQRLQEDLDTTTVYVTHDQTEAMTMGDRIAILNDGELQQVATPLECYYRPANEFVAGFIGEPSMNFLDVTRDGNVLSNEYLEMTVSESRLADVDTADLTLGIRPEDISVDASAESTVVANVNVVEPMGNVTYAHLKIGDVSVTASIDSEQTIAASGDLPIRLPEGRIHLFDRVSGEALCHPQDIDLNDENLDL